VRELGWRNPSPAGRGCLRSKARTDLLMAVPRGRSCLNLARGIGTGA